MPVHIVVVRHGERIDEVDRQEWRRIRTEETQHDPPLTAKGWEQAKSAGKKVAALLQRDASRLTMYSSPTARTLSTAAGILSSFGGDAPSVTPAYSLNCCAAAQSYGVHRAFPKGEPPADVLRGTPLACWPPLGDVKEIDRRQATGGGFVESMKELAMAHSDGDVLVMVTHREGIWAALRHVGIKMQTGYCNISTFSYDASRNSLAAWDPTAAPRGEAVDSIASSAAARASTSPRQDYLRRRQETESRDTVLARGSGPVMIHRNGRGGATSTALWCTPGVRGVWASGGAVPDGEIVSLLSSPVSSEGKEGDFVLVQRACGVEGWAKVCNVQLPA